MRALALSLLAAGGVLLAALACGPAGSADAGERLPARPAPEPECALGINLAGLHYYATEYPFVDAFKLSQPFLHQSATSWSVDEPLELRPDGYPARLRPGRFAGTLIFRDIPTYFPTGEYTCLYDGQGEIELDFAATVKSRSPGRIVVDVAHSEAGIYLMIKRTDPADPIRNIRLLLPGCAELPPGTVFHRDFLARWRGFRVLRFMDWMRTNGSAVVSWEDRNRPDTQTQAADNGVAPEYIAQLCNTAHADPWVCIPHRADDGYVAGLARLLREQLAPERRVYVEYSNEAWNGQFAQADWCRERGLEMGLSEEPFVAQLRYYTHRALQIFAIFEHEFGGRERLVRVLAAQSANPWTSEQILGWEDAPLHADALAIAPYFGIEIGGMERAAVVARLSVDEVLLRCRDHVRETLAHAAAHGRTAAKCGLHLLAYEAGQHLVGHGGAENHEALAELLWAANRHPRMAEAYAAYLDGWRRLGGGLLCAYNSTGAVSKWGSWGHCEHYGPGSEDAPKYRALRAFLATLDG
jgi:hypothetical protein